MKNEFSIPPPGGRGLKNNHTINQLILDIEVENQEQGFLVRNQLSSYWQEWLLEKMDEVFNQINSEKTIQIDKLEIDLGGINLNNFEVEIKEKFSQIFSAEINKKLTFGNDQIEILTPEISDLFTFEKFVKTGQFSWRENGQSINIDELFQRIFKENPEGLKVVLKNILGIQNYRNRIIYQIDNQLLISIFIELFDVKNSISIVELFLKKIKVLDENFEINIPKKQILIVEAIALEISQKNLEFFDLEKKIIGKIIQKIESEIGEKIKLELKEFSEKKEHKNEKIDIENQENIIEEIVENSTEKIYTNHAGLVLLAAYFPTFFKNIGLIINNEFTDLEAKFKAIYLLNYMVTGQKNAVENELSFEKILCGVDLFTPLPKGIYLSETEIEEANDLLKSVRENWQSLQKTSVEGFRSSFLQREGIIYDEGNAWKLRVEKKAFDILLGQIPWNYAFIKFSWTTKPIETEW